MKTLILRKDYAAISHALSENPGLANEGWPYDDKSTKKAHPLHRICDLVFQGILTDEEAVKTATIFLAFGADINGCEMIIRKDTPLIAAASLHADKVAILYLHHHANIHHQGCHGATALHWAAWCGRDIVVKRLIEEGAVVNTKCLDFSATPLFWAVKSYTEKNDLYNQPECIRLLVEAGADINIPNGSGQTIRSMIGDKDLLLRKMIFG